MIEAVLIKGPLTEQDVKELAEAMRKIERRRPHEHFLLTVLDETATNKEATAMLERVFPVVEGVPVELKEMIHPFNMSLPATTVEHHNLTPARDEANKWASICPFCEDGLLLCHRDSATFVLLEFDVCTLCGQRVKYADIAEMRRKDWAKEPSP